METKIISKLEHFNQLIKAPASFNIYEDRVTTINKFIERVRGKGYEVLTMMDVIRDTLIIKIK